MDGWMDGVVVHGPRTLALGLDLGLGLALAGLGQMVSVLLVGRLGEDGLLPHVRGQVAVGLADGLEGGLGCRMRGVWSETTNFVWNISLQTMKQVSPNSDDV